MRLSNPGKEKEFMIAESEEKLMRHRLNHRGSSLNEANDGPITRALRKMVEQRVPNDPRARSYAELIAETMFLEALKGNISAIKEITDRIEGRVSERSERNQNRQPDRLVSFRVIYDGEETTPSAIDLDQSNASPGNTERRVAGA
jgi:hypothetical protein